MTGAFSKFCSEGKYVLSIFGSLVQLWPIRSKILQFSSVEDFKHAPLLLLHGFDPDQILHSMHY